MWNLLLFWESQCVIFKYARPNQRSRRSTFSALRTSSYCRSVCSVVSGGYRMLNVLCALSGWKGRKTLWWGIMFFQILAPSKKASARWENILQYLSLWVVNTECHVKSDHPGTCLILCAWLLFILPSLWSFCPPATRGDGLQWKVQDRRADLEVGKWALCCSWDALPPGRHRHPGDGHPGGHRGLYPVPARRSQHRWFSVLDVMFNSKYTTISTVCLYVLKAADSVFCHQTCSHISTRTSSWLEETLCFQASESDWRLSCAHSPPPTSLCRSCNLQSKFE